MNQIYVAGVLSDHPEDFVFDVPGNVASYLFVFTHTSAVFDCDGQAKRQPAHTCVIYRPFSVVHYTADETRYSDDWMYFSSDEASVCNFPILNTPFAVADYEYVHSLMQLITWEVQHQTGTGGDVASDLVRILFARLYDNIQKDLTTPYAAELYQLHDAIFAEPQKDWSTSAICAHMHISASYFLLLYRNKFGVTCQQDVAASRIQRAKSLLLYTDSSVSDIAEGCGFHSTEHFIRRFKKYTQTTPLSYRKRYLQNSPSRLGEKD